MMFNRKTRDVTTSPFVPNRDATVQAELDKVVQRLHDPEPRKELLRQMRILLHEATVLANSL